MENKILYSTVFSRFFFAFSNNALIANAWKHVKECQIILNQMKKYCPQMEIDGYNNMWILKPGAQSRGRGIQLMNNLSEISSLASGCVSQKENRWVVQKYIGRRKSSLQHKYFFRKFHQKSTIILLDFAHS